jgi:hypothetical protein
VRLRVRSHGRARGIAAQTAVLAVSLLLFASLAAIVVVLILLAARMVVARRDDELIMLRHRGASGRQVATRVLANPAAHRGDPHRRDQPVTPPRSHRPAPGAVTG